MPQIKKKYKLTYGAEEAIILRDELKKCLLTISLKLIFAIRRVQTVILHV